MRIHSLDSERIEDGKSFSLIDYMKKLEKVAFYRKFIQDAKENNHQDHTQLVDLYDFINEELTSIEDNSLYSNQNSRKECILNILKFINAEQSYDVSLSQVIELAANELCISNFYIYEDEDQGLSAIRNVSWNEMEGIQLKIDEKNRLLYRLTPTWKKTLFDQGFINYVKNESEVSFDLERVFEQWQVSSAYILPIFINNLYVGFIGCDSIISRKWKESEIDFFELVSQIIISVIKSRREIVNLKNLKPEAEFVHRAKSEFLVNLSHEIRTPMNNVIGFTELMMSDIETSAKSLKYLQSIHFSSHTLLNLIDDVLELARIESGYINIRTDRTYLPKIIYDLEQIVSVPLREKQMKLNIDISADLPEYLDIDEMRYRQALLYVINSAIKHSNEGEIRVSICKEDSFLDHYITLIIEVEDYGPMLGISDQIKAFEAFANNGQNTYTLDNSLIMAISKKLIETLNGSIRMEQTEQKTNLIKIILPQIKVSDEKYPQIIQSEEKIMELEFQNNKILLVEDDPINSQLVFEYLQNYNIKIIHANLAREALVKIKEFMPDLVLMDIKLPDLDGIETTRIIKSDPILAKIPVLAITAYALKEQEIKISEICDDYIPKPFKKNLLIQKLSKYLPHKLLDVETLPIAKKSVIENMTESNFEVFLELLDFFNNDLSDRYIKLKNSGSFEEIRKFADCILNAGAIFEIWPIEKYGMELLLNARNYDLQNLNENLEYFPKLIKLLNEKK